MNSNPYPFVATERDGRFSIIEQIETVDLFNKFNPIFEKN